MKTLPIVLALGLAAALYAQEQEIKMPPKGKYVGASYAGALAPAMILFIINVADRPDYSGSPDIAFGRLGEGWSEDILLSGGLSLLGSTIALMTVSPYKGSGVIPGFIISGLGVAAGYALSKDSLTGMIGACCWNLIYPWINAQWLYSHDVKLSRRTQMAITPYAKPQNCGVAIGLAIHF